MEMTVIFSDDRGEYLEHYGVPHMKWGVWNAETARKYAGAKKAKADKYLKKANTYKIAAYAADRGLLGNSKTYSYRKNMAKAAKYQRKANRSMLNPLQSPANKAKNERKALKYMNKAQGMSGSVAKVAKYNAKAEKYYYKSEKLEAKANKALVRAEKMEAEEAAAAKAIGKQKVDSVISAKNTNPFQQNRGRALDPNTGKPRKDWYKYI